jgi:hypothetical protein
VPVVGFELLILGLLVECSTTVLPGTTYMKGGVWGKDVQAPILTILLIFRYVPGVGQITAEDTIRREIIHLVSFISFL